MVKPLNQQPILENKRSKGEEKSQVLHQMRVKRQKEKKAERTILPNHLSHSFFNTFLARRIMLWWRAARNLYFNKPPFQV